MAAMEVVGVLCDDHGNVDVDDLRAKAEKYSDILAAVMITYPSTHGVFEERVREICEIVHAHGGQVYLDGANLNAQVGVVYPGKFGADVSHLNLHKTFCIPHGGGGPGVGPIGVGAHLAPFLPGHPQLNIKQPGRSGLRRSLRLGVDPRHLLGLHPADGRRRPHRRHRNRDPERELHRHPSRPALPCPLQERAWPRRPRVHLDTTRHSRHPAGVTVDDIAKRLIDYGFHAPTMSFPVAGTLMVEPTESESKMEIDRFCDAMIAMRNEIRAIEEGQHTIAESPLRFAPHTVFDLTDDVWDRVYTRAQGCFPPTSRRQDKYWAAGQPHRQRLRRPQPLLLLPTHSRIRRSHQRVEASTDVLPDGIPFCALSGHFVTCKAACALVRVESGYTS